MKHRFTYRVWKDGDGHWSQIIDRRRKRCVVKTTWGRGPRQAAVDDARQYIQHLEHSARAA